MHNIAELIKVTKQLFNMIDSPGTKLCRAQFKRPNVYKKNSAEKGDSASLTLFIKDGKLAREKSPKCIRLLAFLHVS